MRANFQSGSTSSNCEKRAGRISFKPTLPLLSLSASTAVSHPSLAIRLPSRCSPPVRFRRSPFKAYGEACRSAIAVDLTARHRGTE
jgi:hypothetical protein